MVKPSFHEITLCGGDGACPENEVMESRESPRQVAALRWSNRQADGRKRGCEGSEDDSHGAPRSLDDAAEVSS